MGILFSRGLSESKTLALTKPLQGIADKLRLLEVFVAPDRSMINKVAHRIAEPRNRAAHAGNVPQKDEVEQCIATAQDVLDEHDPLPTHTTA